MAEPFMIAIFVFALIAFTILGIASTFMFVMSFKDFFVWVDMDKILEDKLRKLQKDFNRQSDDINRGFRKLSESFNREAEYFMTH